MSGPDNKTPETRISADLALRVYQKILDRAAGGQQPPAWQGVSALTDPDGYGVTLTDGTVSARILFHNRVAIQTPNSRSLMRFRRRLADIDGRDAG